MNDKNKKFVRAVVAIICAGMFGYGAVSAVRTMNEYKADRETYENAVHVYLADLVEAEPDATPEPGSGPDETAPVSVDFDALLADAPDVQGWIYCPDTNINYPVVQGTDNNQYLRHDYLGNYATAGSIFVEAANAPDFQDSNTVIYGHHMKDKSMFACLSNWADQAYYDSHKTMWLLTPEQDYKIELFAGYITPAGSDTYAVYQGPSEYFDEYLAGLPGKSDFEADPDIVLDRDARYVVLSTCDYTFTDARYVLHGKLVPVGKAGD